MQFVDLKTQYARIQNDVRKRIDAVLERGTYILGPEVAELEEKLAAYVGVKHCICCSSGTDALLMPLMALNIGPGDAILTTPFTFIATAEVIALLGATPVFVDIDQQTFNIDPPKLRKAIETFKSGSSSSSKTNVTPHTRLKGIIPVDLFGLPADYDEIITIAAEHNLFVLEDAAQSFGAQYKGRMAGNLGHLAATSFFPAKPLGCYGDGGAVFTQDDDLANKILSIRVHGKGADKYNNARVGINGRLDTIQAAILLAKLEIFQSELRYRQITALRYSNALNRTLQTPITPPGFRSAWAQYSVLTDHRDATRTALSDKGVPTAVYYPKPLHLQDAFAHLHHKKGDFPVSEHTANHILSLPMHPYMPAKTIQKITNAIRTTFD